MDKSCSTYALGEMSFYIKSVDYTPYGTDEN